MELGIHSAFMIQHSAFPPRPVGDSGIMGLFQRQGTGSIPVPGIEVAYSSAIGEVASHDLASVEAQVRFLHRA